ncbi:MAG: transporter substrate-binding domain-containing protein [Desulfobacula sp.]|nr:transporter substrate-binding domain-containing protein [Desulfobacula sp.]
MIKIFYIIIILFFCVGFANSLPANELPLATAEWPPYTSSTIKGNGFVTEFVSHVVKEMGMVPVFRFYHWSRTQKIVESGTVFGGFPFGITKDRKKYFNYSDVFLKTNTKFFYDKNKMKDIRGDEKTMNLTSYTIGVIRKSKTFSKLKAGGFKKIYALDNVTQAIEMLKLGRIQFAALVEHTGWYNLQKLFPREKSRWGAIQFYKMEAALLISRSYPDSDELKKKFNQAIKKVQSRKIYEKLLKKYGLPAQ